VKVSKLDISRVVRWGNAVVEKMAYPKVVWTVDEAVF
jgi:hypothetical protein